MVAVNNFLFKVVLFLTNRYLSFISDDDLFKAFDIVFVKYQQIFSNLNFKRFNKNIIDPFEMIFTEKITHEPEDKWIAKEAERQMSKTISNAIGSFQEEILGLAPNFNRYRSGDSLAHSMDIINDSHTIFADVKNKHNTLKGSNKPSLFHNFENILHLYPNATAYYVQIIAKGSFDRIWRFKAKDRMYSNPQIHEISGDQFYSLVFGINDAFYQLISILPQALTDYMNNKTPIYNQGNLTLLNELVTMQTENSYSTLFDTIKESSFNKYIGF